MNENEKMELNEELTSAQNPQQCGVTPNDGQTDAASVCSQTTSPALDIAEASDADPAENSPEAQPDSKGDSVDSTDLECDNLSVAVESEALELDEAAEIARIHDLHALSKEELVGKLKEILDNDDMLAHRYVMQMKQAFYSIRKREADEELRSFVNNGGNIDDFVAQPCEVENQFKELFAEFKSRRTAFLEKDEETRQENLANKFRIIDSIKNLMDDVDNINRNYQEFQRLQQEFKEIKEVPMNAETEVWKQYQSVVEEFYDLLKLNKELRDLDFRKNLEAKRALIEEAKKLVEVADPVAAFRALQDLHTQWREIGPVAKEIRESIWEEFSSASTVINRRHQDFFVLKKQNEQKNEQAKTLLCEKIEALDVDACKSYADWEKMTDEIKALQAEWKTFGFASRKANNQLFARFRSAIDSFFARKSEFYQAAREQVKKNLAKKIALCEKAEALAEGEADADSVRKMRDLQEEWKTIGSVDRRQSDLVWRRFMKACNSLYDRRKKIADSRRQEEKANFETKTRIVADLKAILDETEETGDSIRRMRALQEEWKNTGHVPYAQKQDLNDDYYDTVRKLSAKLINNRRRNGRADNDGRRDGRDYSRDRIHDRIQAKKNDLQTYENNMGFFNVKSAAGNSMVKELERKIERIKKEIAELTREASEMAARDSQND